MKKVARIIISGRKPISEVREYIARANATFDQCIVLSYRENENDSIENVRMFYCSSETILKEINKIALSFCSDHDILITKLVSNFESDDVEKLRSILDEFDQHAIVCPRTNIDGIFAFPYLSSHVDFTNEERLLAWKKYALKYLSRYVVVPVPDSYCVLIRGRIVDNLGFLDESCKNLSTALHVFAMRISRYGYSTLMANNVYVENPDGYLEEISKEIINAQYPEYTFSLNQYMQTDVDPMEYFSRSLSVEKSKKRVLFYLAQLSPVYNGTCEYALALLDSFHARYSKKYEISIVIKKDAFNFHKKSIPKDVVVLFFDEIENTKYQADIVFLTSQYFSSVHLPIVYSLAPRQIGVILDAIGWRCYYILQQSNQPMNFVNTFAATFSDGLVAISKSGLKDIQAYMPTILSKNIPQVYTHLATGFNFSGDDNLKSVNLKKVSENDFLEKKYLLIFGNSYWHKSTREAVSALKDVSILKIVIGARSEDYGVDKNDNFIFFQSGSIPESLMQRIYANAHALIFPSQYEGFGLPIFKAAQNAKKIFVYDNDLNHEIVSAFISNNEQVFFFKKFHDLSPMVRKHLSEYSLPIMTLPTWSKVAEETHSFLDEILNKPVDVEKIRLRWYVSKFWKITFQPESNIMPAEQNISIVLIGKIIKIYLLRKFRRYAKKILHI